MNIGLKRFSFTILFNLSLFMMLMIGIQNSSLKSEVKFLANKTLRRGLAAAVAFLSALPASEAALDCCLLAITVSYIPLKVGSEAISLWYLSLLKPWTLPA